ncbi:MAG: PAS domain-containing protein [Elusimicrobia bacterium]|nr:PAS domain-containing protein [Elusimicrobiota bacterium]
MTAPTLGRFKARIGILLCLILAAASAFLPLFWLGLLGACALGIWRHCSSLAASLREIFGVVERLGLGDRSARVRRLPAGDPELGELINNLAEKISVSWSEFSKERLQLSAVLSNIAEAIVGVDSHGLIIALNPALAALFSADRGAALGRPFVEILRHARLQELLSEVMKEGTGRSEEVTVFTPEEKIFEAHAVALVLEGQGRGALIVLHDITRLRRLERMRREFVANVSHELRTPLAAIRGFAETLREGGLKDSEHGPEFVEGIEREAERLSALVEDLLDLSAIEAGHRLPVKVPVSILVLACEAAASLAPMAERRKIRVHVEAEAVPIEVRADRSQIKQVLANLIDNAIKFNRERGRVEISAAVEGKFLKVVVSDTGPGMAREHLPRVFERFYRADDARSRELGGTGLGLAIVKHIVESHGGSAGVESAPGEGSSFFFTLPL